MLNYGQHSPNNKFLYFFLSHMLFRHFVQLARIRNNFKTLIDNIYSNAITPHNISGNLTDIISDYLPQFLTAPYVSSNPPSTKLNIFERDWSMFHQENFILKYLSVDWKNSNESNNGNVDQSFFWPGSI